MNSWVSILLVHLVRCSRTIERAKGRLEPKDLGAVYNAYSAFFWATSLDYYNQYERVIPKSSLEAKTCEYIKEFALYDELDAIASFLDYIYSFDEADLNYAEAVEYLGKVLSETRLRGPVQEALLDPSVSTDDLQGVIDRGMAAAKVSSVSLINPLDCLAEVMGRNTPKPLGSQDISYFNYICNNGLKEGEIAIVMGPSGGFKTTMAVDIVCSMAEVGERSIYFTYEQAYAHGGDLPLRFAARLSRLPYPMLEETKSPELLSAEDQEKLSYAVGVSSHAQIADRSSSCDRLSDIIAVVREFCDKQGEPPKLIIIDQLLNWVQAWLNIQEERATVIQLVKEIKAQLCEKYHTRVVLLHQIAASEMGKQNKLFDMSNSAEVRGIGFNADFIITMSRADDSCIFRAASVKARRGASREAIIRAEPTIYRLHNVTDEYEESATQPGQFVPKGDGNRISTLASGKITQGSWAQP